jgi:hypothetical protein
MDMKQLRKTLVSGLMAAGFSAAAFAAPAMPDHAGTEHGGTPGMQQQHRGGNWQEHIARHQATLHDKLKLTANQEAAWKNYIAAATPPAPPTRPDRAEWEKLSAPERMEKMLAMMKEREAHMATQLQAMKTFYATLSPLQQQIFNDNVGFRPRHGHGRG